MVEQMELAFGRRRLKRDVRADVDRVCQYLLRCGNWRTRSDICASLSMDERSIREAGENSDGQIIFGQEGMKHIRHATADEVKACVNTLYGVARCQIERAKAVERRYHKSGGAVNPTGQPPPRLGGGSVDGVVGSPNKEEA